MDRLKLFVWLSLFGSVVVLIMVRLGPSPVWVAALMMALFMIPMSGRFAPAMTMVTNAVEARYRGGFMSLNAALQQAASGLANVVAGWFVTTGPGGRLVGYPNLGYVSVACFGLAVLCAVELRRAAPHVATPGMAGAHTPLPVEAEAIT